ncbi:MAG: 1-phosphofructokinase [Oscillochloridaceae bacterium]|nr:1-phosphofructokinase [Chloroflexaceae bacterium]MDW8390833.1 1-phosphofructokinase [Oscillochloridaceae bacterium]
MSATPEMITVTLNPAIDRTVTITDFAAGKVNRVEQVQDHPGGKGVNVAVTLADAGHRVAATGFLGRENATSFEDLFARKGIADQFVRIAGRTRVGIKIIDPVRQQTTDINFPGPAPAPLDLDALRARLAASPAPWVVLAGSLPPGVAPTLYRDLIGELRARGRSVALDTSGEPLAAAITAAPRIIKPNIHELEALIGAPLPGEAAIIAAARKLLTAGIELAVVSMGSAGALFITASEALRAVPPQVTARSTVGAGDAMVAGIVAAQARGYDLEATARLATAFAVDAISRVGAGLGDRATLADLARRVAVSVVMPALV